MKMGKGVLLTRSTSKVDVSLHKDRRVIMLKALAVVFYEGLVDDHSIAGSLSAIQRVFVASRIILFPGISLQV